MTDGTAVSRAPAPERTITVTGQGRALGRPDEAEVNLGVDFVRPTAGEARAAAAAAMTAVVAALGEAGVGPDDIRTTDLSLAAEIEYGPQGAPRRIGFRLANRVAIRVARTDDVARIVDSAITAGATSVDGVRFRVADPGEARRTALAGAMDDARAAAEAVAAAAGARLIGVRSIRETDGAAMPPGPRFALMEAGAVDTPVAPGLADVSATLEVSWAIDDAPPG